MDVVGPAGRLRTLIRVDAVITLTAAVFLTVIRLTVITSGYLVALAIAVALTGLVMVAALRPLDDGDVARALLLLSGANWAIAVIATTVATFAWPVMLVAALFPSVLAASLISGRTLGGYVAVSVVASLTVVLLGLFQDFSGLSELAPKWLRDTILVIFTPALVGLVALVALNNGVSLQVAVSEARASRAELAEQAAELRRSRARLVTATDRERRRIERDLHDGAQQQLIALGIGLTRARQICRSNPEEAAVLLDRLRRELRNAHDELRRLSQGVYPPVLTEHGLEAALQSAADRCSVPVALAFEGTRRHSPDVEAALYFCAVEALQNAEKHGAANRIVVRLVDAEPRMTLTVADDGVGFDPGATTGGTGLVNLRDRLGALGGGVEVESRPGHGTSVRGFVPLAG
jgi:signal transduction histidine kinase